MMADRTDGFCPYIDIRIAGAASGPLEGLTFAAKDLYDIAGHVTGGSNPDWLATHPAAEKHAWAVETLLAAGATLTGKTITDELSLGLLGENAHYGTPENPRAADRVPGGSSSGSVSAVAGGHVDFALGSDTGGSVRVPAGFCGLYGMRTTHGRIPLDGVLKQAPSYDTVGWFARDADLFARVSAVMLQGEIPAVPPARMVIAADAFEVADAAVQDALAPVVDTVAAAIGESATERVCPTGLDAWKAQQGVLQGREAWESFADWIDRTNPRFAYDVARNLAQRAAITDAEVAAAKPVRAALIERIDELTRDGGVICMPTAPFPAPLAGRRLSKSGPDRDRIRQLTCIASASGAPQITLPLATVDGFPVGLSLLGAPGSDEMLAGFARLLASGTR